MLVGCSQPSPLECFIKHICWAPSLISVLRTMYGIDASSTRNRFEFIQLLHSRAAAVINNQIEMPSITRNVCLMKRAGGLKNGNYNVSKEGTVLKQALVFSLSYPLFNG